MNSDGSRLRGVLALGVVMAALGVMIGRLAYLHLWRGAEKGGCNPNRTYTMAATRGSVCDRQGQRNVVALNLAARDVCVDPAFLVKSNKAEAVAGVLENVLGLPASQTLARVRDRADRRYFCVQRFVPVEKARQLAAAKLPGVTFEDVSVRFYPHGSFLCHVLGFVNHAGLGSAGVEQYADAYLRGAPGYLETRVNALSEEIYSHRRTYIAPLEGATVELTIDQNIQDIVERGLDRAMEQHHAKGACAIVEDVRTGEILALASRPAYDLNRFQEAGDQARVNRCIGTVYEPGSTFKAITIAAALNEHVVTPEMIFDCENGAWSYGGRLLRDFHPYGRLTVADGVKKSSNILCAKAGCALGKERLHDYARRFGIGSRMGLDLPGEEAGILRATKDWSGICITRVAIGQSVAVTALQMLGVFCAIANDGKLMRPHVVRRVVSQDRAVIIARGPEVLSSPIRPDTAATMRRLLTRVTEDGGTGTRARVEGYAVAGKTGTAQKPEGGGYSTTAHMASFVGFLPADQPRIGLIVVVDEPQPIRVGGLVAAPAFSAIASETVRYLDIPPEPYAVARR